MAVKRSATVLIIVVMLLVVAADGASAQLVGTVKDVEVSVGTTGKIDFTTQVITAVGIGAPPANPANPAAGPRHGRAGGPGRGLPEPS